MDECTKTILHVFNNHTMLSDEVSACATESQDMVVDRFEFEYQ